MAKRPARIPPHRMAEHQANLAELKAKRAACKAAWAKEDADFEREIAVLRARHEAARTERMAGFDRGLEAFKDATGIDAHWDD